MSRFPLSGLARSAVAVTAATLLGASLTVPAPAAASPRTSPFVSAVQNAHDDAMGCRLTDTPGARGLQPWSSAVRSRVAAQFDMTTIGGYRPGQGRSDHHTGHAIDVMVRGERGTEIADWFRDNAADLNVKYVIWEQGYWHPGMRGYRPMEDRGNDTANHYDHVHISFHTGTGTCPA